MGPVAGVIIEFVKNLIHFFFRSETGELGTWQILLMGVSFVFPAGLVYSLNRTKKGALIGMIFGTVAMAILASLANYYVLIPMYARIFFNGSHTGYDVQGKQGYC